VEFDENNEVLIERPVLTPKGISQVLASQSGHIDSSGKRWAKCWTSLRDTLGALQQWK